MNARVHLEDAAASRRDSVHYVADRFPAFDWKKPDYQPVWDDRMAKLEGLRKVPGAWQPLREHYAKHPVEFICDWGCTFDPRNAVARPDGTVVPTTMPFLLFERQAEFILWLLDRFEQREDGIVEKSRDMGVSWLCVGFAVWLWTFFPGSVTGFGSRKEDLVDELGNPDSLFWKVRMFIDMLPFELKPKGYEPKKDAPYMKVLNRRAESSIVGEAGDNIGRGGRTTLYLKDESAHYEHPEAIDAALSQNTNVQIDVSTPNGEGNPFWQKAHGGKTKKFVFDWRDDPRKGAAWYAAQQNRMTAVALAAEVDRDYSASISNSFIPGTVVGNAMARGPADVRPHGGLMVGLDVARFGDDSNVLTFRRGRVVIKQVTWRKVDTVATVGRTRQAILAFRETPAQIAVDTIGIGSGVADQLRGFDDFKDVVVDVNSSLKLSNGEHYNLRAFMWQAMKDWLDGASLPVSNELRASLTSLRYFYKAGELLIESKEDAKKRGIKSPDEADSLALTFAYPPKPRTPNPGADQQADDRPDPETGM